MSIGPIRGVPITGMTFERLENGASDDLRSELCELRRLTESFGGRTIQEIKSKFTTFYSENWGQ